MHEEPRNSRCVARASCAPREANIHNANLVAARTGIDNVEIQMYYVPEMLRERM